MSVSTLQRFTVPLEAGQTSATQGLLMPKLQYRFRVSFQGFGSSPATDTMELTKQVRDFTRPQIDFDDITLDVYNSKIRMAGRHTWSDITITLLDDQSGRVSRQVGEQLQKQFDFFEQASAASGADYKFTTVCQMLDGGNGQNEPSIVEQWEMYGCFIQNANYNTVAYNTSEPVTISLTLRFDNAIQVASGEDLEGGVGNSTTRPDPTTGTATV